MIGFILGLILVVNLWIAAFTGSFIYLGFFALSLPILLIIGIFLFPKTIGMSFTLSIFTSPIFIIGGGIVHGWGMFFTTLGIAAGMWLINQIIAFIRPESLV